MNWRDSVVLVTGGTGSFGKMFTQTVLRDYQPKKLIVFSRDELKQHDMRMSGFDHPNIRYFLGDVRDLDRLRMAFRGVDLVVHAAALKQVPACEYNPFEAVQTNIIGSKNIITAALDAGVKQVMALSTDKAVNPVNLYGATKLAAEKMFLQASVYAGLNNPILFSCVRYGNVIGSRGSVVPLFRQQREKGRLTITDDRMTRFWITLEQAVRFVIRCIESMEGGEVFVPKIPSTAIIDLAKAIAPECPVDVIGIRPGEKLHEVLLSEDEARESYELPDMYVIQRPKGPDHPRHWSHGKPVPEDFRYASNTNTEWLRGAELTRILESVG
ncbi:MAG: UDP-N-acetylglucosamine 4,6-dehydratase (inverting) [Planctomycetes bacterium]|nr:UDP-N-acetylglucosamine 4,6-dehydratase (inverting) [Planctomycetota bacterium]